MVTVNEKDRVLAKAGFFLPYPPFAEAPAKSFKDDRHPLSVQRGRNILRWADDPELVHKWQTVFVPQVETAIPGQMQRQPPSRGTWR